MDRHGTKEFGKAQVSSLLSTAVDFLVTAMVYSITLHVVCSTALGAVTGGMTNCVINYRWTFHGTTRRKRSVAFRYTLVWVGSVILNTAGTEWGVKGLEALHAHLAFAMEAGLSMVLIVKAAVAVAVAVFWNFLMQKHYVYRDDGRCRLASHSPRYEYMYRAGSREAAGRSVTE